MGKLYNALTPELRAFIAQQKLFFVATAGEQGAVNVSPKGMDSLRVMDEHTVRWLNLTGSGNETAAHVLENGRMTLMFCAFEGKPLILRLYGQARTIHPRDPQWAHWLADFPALPGARQIFELHIERAQTSCGMAVPFYDFVGEREQLNRWAEKKGEAGIEQYWREKNALSLDGKSTGI
jgi:hypothetical protein